MSETILITKKEYDSLIGIKKDFIKYIKLHNRTMEVHDRMIENYEEKCEIYKKALRM